MTNIIVHFERIDKSADKAAHKAAFDEVEKHLEDYDRKFFDTSKNEEFVIRAYDGEQLVGGVAGIFDLGWLYIDLLWVEEKPQAQRAGHKPYAKG